MNYNKHEITITRQGLASCDVCNGGEGTLAAECPREPVDGDRQRAILRGELEFVRGKWWVPEKIASREPGEAQEAPVGEGKTPEGGWVPEETPDLDTSRDISGIMAERAREDTAPSYEELAGMHNDLLEDHARLQAEVARLRGEMTEEDDREPGREFEYYDKVRYKDGWVGRITSINWAHRTATVAEINGDNSRSAPFDDLERVE